MFTLPQFNLTVNIWRNANYPGVPDVVTVGNLAYGRRVHVDIVFVPPPAVVGVPMMQLLLPALTDVRDAQSTGHVGDLVEVPAGSGRLYLVLSVDDAGKGFTNEHRVAQIGKNGPWPSPIP